MADDILVTAGAGTTIAADDVGGSLHQRVKVTWGPDGTGNDTDIASGKPLPAQLRVADGTAWTYGAGNVGSGSPRVILAADVGLPAGANYLGQVGGTSAWVFGTLNSVNPAVIAAAGDYAAGDILSHHVTAGVTWQFPNIARANGLGGLITKGRITCSVEGLVPRTRLWLFDADVTTTEVDDNVAFSITVADRALVQGYYDFPAMADVGTMSYAQNTTDRLSFKCGAARILYGVLQTLDAFTNETASMTIDIALHVEQN